MAEVLLVEDDEDFRDLLAGILQTKGYEVVLAGNGAEALALMKGGLRPCIILLDLMMPVMDGWTFRQAQLADPAIASIPVIVLSAVSDYSRPISGLMMRKPGNIPLIAREIDTHCQGC